MSSAWSLVCTMSGTWARWCARRLISRTSVDFPAPGGLSTRVVRSPAATALQILSRAAAAAAAGSMGCSRVAMVIVLLGIEVLLVGPRDLSHP